MPKIVFVEYDGTEHVVDAEAGMSVMQAAINNLVPGIVADCGGLCACATCHGYVDAKWLLKIPSQRPDEGDLLTGAPRVGEGSRLTCQIVVRPDLDGMVVRLPESQY